MECPVCGEEFDFSYRRPKVLPCGHTFCLRCLQQLQTKTCPLDKRDFLVPPETFTDNYILLQECANPDTSTLHRSLGCLTCNKNATAECVDDEHALCSLKKLRAEDARRLQDAIDRGTVTLNSLSDSIQAAGRDLNELYPRTSSSRLDQERANLAKVKERLLKAQGASTTVWEEAKRQAAALTAGLPHTAAHLMADLADPSVLCDVTVRRGPDGVEAWRGEVRPVEDAAARVLLYQLACSRRLQQSKQPDGEMQQLPPTPLCQERSNDTENELTVENVIERVAEDIAAVKAQFYDAEEIRANLNTSDEILRNLIRFTDDRASDFQAVRKLALEARRFLEGAMKGMLKGSQSGARRVPPLSTGEAKNLEQRVQILNGLRQIVEEGLQPAALSANGRKELKEAVELVCGSLSQRTLTRLSEQEASDTNMEMERLRRLLQLLQVEAEFSGNDIKPFLGTDLEKYEDICKILRGLSPYSMDLDREVDEKLQQLQKLIKPSSCAGISRVQLRSIVAATGLGAGHWYRCPRGHTYAIGNCGQALQKAICPVEGCRASIGGDKYGLSSGNTRAADIEGGI